jgi:hypothetical protein
MAFCNKCGANLNPDAKFCDKCGAPAGAPAVGQPAQPAPTGGGSSALKVVLIVVGVVVVLGILAIAALTIVGIHIAKNAHVTQNGDQVKVETPFGSVQTNKDPEQAARDLGIEIYPGAKVEPNGAASATVGTLRTVTANFETSDSPDKVCNFYKSKLPNATVSTSGQNQCSIVSKENRNMITVNVESSGNGARFQIATVTK